MPYMTLQTRGPESLDEIVQAVLGLLDSEVAAPLDAVEKVTANLCLRLEQRLAHLEAGIVRLERGLAAFGGDSDQGGTP